MGQLQLSKLLSTRRSLNEVNEEYNKALHAKSYVDTCSRLQQRKHNLNRTSTAIFSLTKTKMMWSSTKLCRHAHSSLLSYGSDDDCVHDHLLQRSQEPLLTSTTRLSSSSGILGGGRFHLHLNNLLLDFFDTTLQAGTACASLLSSIDRARAHHYSIHTLLHDISSASSTSTIFSELSSHLEIQNPLSPQNLSYFHHIHSRYPTLIRRLTSARRKIARRINLIKFTKKASGIAIIALFFAAAAATVVLATHGTAKAPVRDTGACDRLRLRPRRWFKGWVRLERAKARMDAAAKGAYIVGRDMDTMSQMLRRVHDEVEYGRDVVRMVVRNREWETVMRDVVKEMEEGRRGEVGLGFEEQLKELEEHVYLCLTTINKSSRLVAREMQEASDMA